MTKRTPDTLPPPQPERPVQNPVTLEQLAIELDTVKHSQEAMGRDVDLIVNYVRELARAMGAFDRIKAIDARLRRRQRRCPGRPFRARR